MSLTRSDRGRFFFLGLVVFFLTILATPSIMIMTFFDHLFNPRTRQ
jgi:hypothetical protein